MRNRNSGGGPTRRSLLKGLGALGAVGAAGGLGLNISNAQVSPDSQGDPRYLIVLAASGGASIIDGPLAIRSSESANAGLLNTFPDQLVSGIDGLPFRAVDQRREELGQIPVTFDANQSDFVRRHGQDMMVSTWTRTSVNHFIGQRRALTGNEAWAGRTLQEMVAFTHGRGFALPNVHLQTGGGFTTPGTDRSLPDWCFGEVVSDPGLWPLALDGGKGLVEAPPPGLLARARALRNDRLDPNSRFGQVFGASRRIRHWKSIRGERQQAIEGADLIRKLMVRPSSGTFPLNRFGLNASPVAERVRQVFPKLEYDPLEAQAALAFLLLKYGVSVTVTLGPGGGFVYDGDEYGNALQSGGLPDNSVLNTPIAFDFSHNGHRSVQALMWQRLYRVADGLITLLKEEEFADGQSMWDRSMIYIPTDFGREKKRPDGADEWSTSHHLNNGVLAISPMVNGGKVLGGVDPDTALTYGFDPRTGAPEPGRTMDEPQIFSGLLGAMGVDTAGSGLPDVPAMRRS